VRVDSAQIPDRLAKLMSPADRRALGLLVPEERQAKIQHQREADLQRLCESELSRRGIVYLHLSWRAREKAGWPDLTFCVNGRPLAVELKTTTGVVSDEQNRVLARMEANGWQVAVVRSVDAFIGLLNNTGRILNAAGVR